MKLLKTLSVIVCILSLTLCQGLVVHSTLIQRNTDQNYNLQEIRQNEQVSNIFNHDLLDLKPLNLPNDFRSLFRVGNEVNLDLSQTVRDIPDQMYGINGFGSMVIHRGSDPAFINNLKYMNPKIIRFHDNIVKDAVENWRAFAYNDGKTWARWRLQDFSEMIRLWRANGITAEITLTLNGFPDWMETYSPSFNGKNANVRLLKQSDWREYSDLMADLIEILNVEQNLGIQNIEIFNEQDDQYSVRLQDQGIPRKMTELAQLYHLTAAKIKNVDPSVKIGGIALARADRLDGIQEFVQELSNLGENNLDFFSYHTYASGNVQDSDTQVFDTIKGNIGYFTPNIRAILDTNGFSDTKIILNEYNLNWNGSPDPRMTNSKSATFDSLAIISGLKSGLNEITPWTDMDEAYGKMDMNFNLRSGASVIKMFSDNVTGKIITSSINQNLPNLSTLGFVNNSEQTGVVLVNQGNEPITIKLTGLPHNNNPVLLKYIEASTNLVKTTSLGNKARPRVVIEPYSTIIVYKN